MRRFIIYVILFATAAWAQTNSPVTVTVKTGTIQKIWQYRDDGIQHQHQEQEQAKKPPTVEELQAQVTQLQQQVAQKDQQIAAMSAQLTASGKMFSACFQSLAEAEQRAAAKK